MPKKPNAPGLAFRDGVLVSGGFQFGRWRFRKSVTLEGRLYRLAGYEFEPRLTTKQSEQGTDIRRRLRETIFSGVLNQKLFLYAGINRVLRGEVGGGWAPVPGEPGGGQDALCHDIAQRIEPSASPADYI